MAGLDAAVAAQLAGATVRPAILLLVKTTEGDWLRAWSAFGDFALPADGIDTTGGVYRGVGELVDAPAVSQLINGLAERIVFSLSGVDPAVLALAEEDAEALRGAPAHLALVALGADWAPLHDAYWLWEGEADSLRVIRSGDVRSVSISVGTPHTGRTRPSLGFFTGVEQRRRSPDDRFCDRVNLYSANATVRWPT